MISKISRWRLLIGLIYIGLILYLVFFAPFRYHTNTDVNFIPFKSIIGFIDPWINEPYGATTHYRTFVIYNLVGNFLVFFPLPFIFKWNPKIKWAILFSLSIPLLIETSQFIFQKGSANIDDLMLNGVGFFLGFMVYRSYVKCSLPKY